MQPEPMFAEGEIVGIDPSKIYDQSQPLIGKVVRRSFGWRNRDDSLIPVWVYELEFPHASGSPIILWPETYLLSVTITDSRNQHANKTS